MAKKSAVKKAPTVRKPQESAKAHKDITRAKYAAKHLVRLCSTTHLSLNDPLLRRSSFWTFSANRLLILFDHCRERIQAGLSRIPPTEQPVTIANVAAPTAHEVAVEVATQFMRCLGIAAGIAPQPLPPGCVTKADLDELLQSGTRTSGRFFGCLGEDAAELLSGQTISAADWNRILAHIESESRRSLARLSTVSSDTEKKKPGRRLHMTVEATECATLYRKRRRENAQVTMKSVVEEWAKENPCAVEYTLRVLNDNPDQWKCP